MGYLKFAIDKHWFLRIIHRGDFMNNRVIKEKDEKFDKKLSEIIEALQKAVSEEDLPLQWDIDYFASCIGLTDSQKRRDILVNGKEGFRNLVNDIFVEKWKKTLKENFDTNGIDAIVTMLENSIKGNPVKTFEVFVDVFLLPQAVKINIMLISATFINFFI